MISRIIVMSMLITALISFLAPGAKSSVLDTNAHLMLRPAAKETNRLRVTFMGVSTLLFDDGQTAILTDGFFSRPKVLAVATAKIAPDKELIHKSLERAGISKLAAVLVAHSHYDHAMDSPEVAARTGALLIGSESTANIARGSGFNEERMRVIKGGESFKFGRFEITCVATEHMHPLIADGEITKPLKPPARALDYKEGGSYSYLIKHDGRSLLVHASAGIAHGALKGHKADVVFLGVGGLGKLRPAFRDEYWDELVKSVGARRVIPIHWDDFSKPLDKPLTPIPWPFDDFKKTMAFLSERGQRDGVDIKIANGWLKFDPFQEI